MQKLKWYDQRWPLIRHEVMISIISLLSMYSQTQGPDSTDSWYEDYFVTEETTSKVTFLWLFEFLALIGY